jgi:hypothetical protein
LQKVNGASFSWFLAGFALLVAAIPTFVLASDSSTSGLPGGGRMSNINSLWHSQSEAEWLKALDKYNQYITRPEIAALDKEIDPLDLNMVKRLNTDEWYTFLYQKYFPWKYTAPNRLATTRASLEKHRERPNGLADIRRIKQELLVFPKQDIQKGLNLATQIGGLGIAGASGLLALMYPEHFGTVDEFLVLALAQVDNLPERAELREMATKIGDSKKPKGKPFSIELNTGTMLIEILRRKSKENNRWFNTSFWTPRKLDKVLWAYGHFDAPTDSGASMRLDHLSKDVTRWHQSNPQDRTPDDLNRRDREHYEVARQFSAWFTSSEFQRRYRAIYPDRSPGSIIPSDYCFNRENKGNKKYPRFLLWDNGQRYQFVGLDGKGGQ